MSRIARRLCNDVVDHPWKASNKDLTLNKTTTNKTIHEYTNNNKKPKRLITIEKKKVTNKLSNPVRDLRHNIKCRESVSRKRILDASANTLISGPLQCDHDCVTVLRKRDKRESCKCNSPRCRNTSVCSIQVQTLDANIFHTNKACSAFAEMANCSTQVYDISKCPYSIRKQSRSKMFNYNKPTNENREKISRTNIKKMCELTQNKCSNKMIKYTKATYLNSFSGARRWALSRQPILGPDF